MNNRQQQNDEQRVERIRRRERDMNNQQQQNDEQREERLRRRRENERSYR